MSNLVTDGAIESASGVIDIRATYGGLSIAVGLLLVIMAMQLSMLNLSLGFTSLILFAMAAGRILGILLDGQANLLMYVYLALELVVGSAALFYWKTSNSTPTPTR